MPIAEAMFTVPETKPVDWTPDIETALPTGHMHMVKQYAGAIEGRSITQFSASFDPTRGIGTYIALESFEGSVDGRSGTCNFVHSATTDGASPERLNEFFLIVPGSGTRDLDGITGTGGMRVDNDGTHRVWFNYALPAGA